MLSRLLPLARYRVEGESMVPGVGPGEGVIVNRLSYRFSVPRAGDLVVVRDPRRHDRLLLKRLDRPAGDDAWLVLGDNPDGSTDSRTFGPVPTRLIVGKVWLRY